MVVLIDGPANRIEQAEQVPGWPAYRVTRSGRIFGHKGELKERANTRGYPSVVLQESAKQENGRIWYAKVSQVVALTFLGPANARQVRHLDDDKMNSNLENLAYGTAADNAEDARRNGRLMEGEKHGNSKYTAEQIKEVRRLRKQGATLKQIQELTGVHQCTAWQVLKGFHWRSVV